MSWCTIESDPAVFNEMIEKMGVKQVEVVEVPVLDELERMKDVYGLIFLFKWKPVPREVTIVEAPDVYFAKQMVTNACATQAIINVLLNADQVDIGTQLTDFKSFTAPLSPDQRGECMGAQEMLREVHNSFSRPPCFSFEESSSGSEDAYHFTAYIPKSGFLYELDGLKAGPIMAGETGQGSWLEAAIPLLQERVAVVQSHDTTGNGLMFSLLAVTKDRISVLEDKLQAGNLTSGDEIAIQTQLSDLKEAKQKGIQENARRRHNYIPLVVSCLKALAERGKLGDFAAEAQKRAEAKLKAKQEKQAAAKK